MNRADMLSARKSSYIGDWTSPAANLRMWRISRLSSRFGVGGTRGPRLLVVHRLWPASKSRAS